VNAGWNIQGGVGCPLAGGRDRRAGGPYSFYETVHFERGRVLGKEGFADDSCGRIRRLSAKVVGHKIDTCEAEPNCRGGARRMPIVGRGGEGEGRLQ